MRSTASCGPTLRSQSAKGHCREPLTRQQIDLMTERYRDRQLRHRARVIARTEALRPSMRARMKPTSRPSSRATFLRDEVCASMAHGKG